MKIAICIPSFGHRDIELISHLNEANNNKYDILIFIQNNDVNKQLYYNDNFNNVKYICSDAKNIYQNRQQIIDYTINNGYEKIIMCDDDLGSTIGKIDESTKRTTSDSYRKYNVDIFEAFDKLCETCDEYNAGTVGIYHDIYLGFSKPGAVTINKQCSVTNIVLINLNNTFKKFPDLHYADGSINIAEDIDIAIQMRQHNIDIVTIRDYGFSAVRAYSNSAIFSSMDKRNESVYNTAKKWKLPLRCDKKGNLQLRVLWDKYVNNSMPEPRNKFEEGLFKLYDNEASYDEVYNYIKNK